MSAVHFEIYIDREFVKCVDEQRFAFSEDLDLQDFYRFITKLQGVDVITNYESLDEFEKIVDTSPFWLKLYDGTFSPTIQKDFCHALSKSSFYAGSTGFKLFFVERDDVEVLSHQFGLLYVNSSNLLKVWKLFSDEREDLALPITENTDCNPRFDNWSYLRHFTHPLNSIILCDRYILQNKQDFEANVFDLLKCLKCYNLPQLNILLISELIGSEKQPDGKWIKVDNDINDYGELIRNRLIGPQKIKKLNMSVIKLTNTKQKDFYREHDRSLVTNYWYINPQNSFNFFDATSQRKLIVRSNIDFRFVFRKQVRNLLKERMAVINDIVQHTTDSSTMKKVYISGGEKSQLLIS